MFPVVWPTVLQFHNVFICMQRSSSHHAHVTIKTFMNKCLASFIRKQTFALAHFCSVNNSFRQTKKKSPILADVCSSTSVSGAGHPLNNHAPESTLDTRAASCSDIRYQQSDSSQNETTCTWLSYVYRNPARQMCPSIKMSSLILMTNTSFHSTFFFINMKEILTDLIQMPLSLTSTSDS